jgi:vibriolysin
LVRGIAADIHQFTPVIPAEVALQSAKEAVQSGTRPGIAATPTKLSSRSEDTRLVVYVRSSDQVARLSYEVTFFAVPDAGTEEPMRPVFIIDAMTGETLFYYDSLTSANGTGPGGNEKTHQYFYGPGKQFPSFEVSELGDGQCSLSNTVVDTEDLNEGKSNIGAPFKYPCYDNTKKTINGGYAPMNDAHYYGSLVHKMWTDWYGEPPVNQKLVMRVHYDANMEQAYWDEGAVYFGDGQTASYPWVALDVVSHEIAHGYTQQHSDLKYVNQSGGINEAFSDMAAQAAEYYQNVIANPSNPREPDFLIGATIMKQQPALRYMCDPTNDGKSIASAKKFTEGMNPHVSSGVYNKAFCILAKSKGWDARKAFQVFQAANRDFWTPGTNFQSGAEGVRDAAKNLRYSVDDIINAFSAVDIAIEP